MGPYMHTVSCNLYLYICECMRARMCLPVYACGMFVHVSLHMSIRMCVCMFECICMYAYAHTCVCEFVRVHAFCMFACTYINFVFVCVCVCVCMCVCDCVPFSDIACFAGGDLLSRFSNDTRL